MATLLVPPVWLEQDEIFAVLDKDYNYPAHLLNIFSSALSLLLQGSPFHGQLTY